MIVFHSPLITTLIAVSAAGQATAPLTRSQAPDALRWSLEDLFRDDAAWEKEKAVLTQELEALAPASPARSPGDLADALARLDALDQRFQRLSVYAKCRHDEAMADPGALDLYRKAERLGSDMRTRHHQMAIATSRMDIAQLEAYAQAEPRLRPYLPEWRRRGRAQGHTLGEEAQRVVDLSGSFCGTPIETWEALWNLDMPDGAVVLHDGSRKAVNLQTLPALLSSPDAKDRRAAAGEARKRERQIRHACARLLEGAAQGNLWLSRSLGFPTRLSQRFFAEELSSEVVRDLLEAVRGGSTPLRKLAKLRAQISGLPDYGLNDLAAPLVPGAESSWTYKEAAPLLLEALAPLGPQVGQTLRKAFAERWIDVLPRPGKLAGVSYAIKAPGVHPYVKIDFDGSLRSLTTLAHEVGHAIQDSLNEEAQPYPLSGVPGLCGEVASTLNEILLVHFLIDREKDDRARLALLARQLQLVQKGLFRQILVLGMEVALYDRLERGESLPADWLDATWLAQLRGLYGDSLDIQEASSSEWAGQRFLFLDFYSFRYALGQLAAMALAEGLLADPARQRAYLEFLKAGTAEAPLDVLRKAGLDFRTRQPVEAALGLFSSWVSDLEATWKRLESTRTPEGAKHLD